MDISRRLLPCKYVNIPTAVQQFQFSLQGLPDKSLCKRGLPTGVDFGLVPNPKSFVSMFRNEMILSIRKGWELLNLFSSR